MPQPLTPRLHAPTKLYRAITRRQEIPDVHIIYQPGRSPTHYTQGRRGDFCYDGALYAFTDRDQAIRWGAGVTKSNLSRDHCFYLVELDYTPRGLQTITFYSDTPQWSQFTYQNTNHHRVGHAPLVEGPLSNDGIPGVAYLFKDNFVYQAAFIGQQALSCLVVNNVTIQYSEGLMKGLVSVIGSDGVQCLLDCLGCCGTFCHCIGTVCYICYRCVRCCCCCCTIQ